MPYSQLPRGWRPLADPWFWACLGCALYVLAVGGRLLVYPMVARGAPSWQVGVVTGLLIAYPVTLLWLTCDTWRWAHPARTLMMAFGVLGFPLFQLYYLRLRERWVQEVGRRAAVSRGGPRVSGLRRAG